MLESKYPLCKVNSESLRSFSCGVMEGSEEGPRDPAVLPRGKRIPLNSRKLTVAHLKQIAKAMELPTVGSADELRQQIEGKLTSQEGCEVSTVQVIVQEKFLIETQLWLVDSGGVVLQTEPVRKTGKEDTAEQLRKLNGQLAEELDVAREEIVELKRAQEGDQQTIADLRGELESGGPTSSTEVSRLREALRVEKQRAKEQWKWNCDHIAEQDAIISTKDDEIAELKRQLTTRSHSPLRTVPHPQ